MNYEMNNETATSKMLVSRCDLARLLRSRHASRGGRPGGLPQSGSRALSDVVRPSFDLKSWEGARGVQAGPNNVR